MGTGGLFGTDGIRGRVGQWPLIPEFVLRLGQAIGDLLRHQGPGPQVLIGRDTRLSGAMLEHALAAGLLAAGVDLHHAGIMPTPAIAYLTHRWGMQAGIAISASHNPYPDNGFKLFGPDGFKFPDEIESQIERLARGDSPMPSALGMELGHSRQRLDGTEAYHQFLLGALPAGKLLHNMRILIDCADGAASAFALRVFRELGAECHARHYSPDGFNINTSYEYLTPHVLARSVVEEGMNLGIALDGDGDRAIFVDEKGGFVNGDVTLAILAREMDAAGTLVAKTVVATVMSNLGLDVSLQEVQIRLERTQVGDRYVTQRMREGGYTLGGEQAGHIVILGQGHTAGDGLYTALHVCRTMVDHGATLSELASHMHPFPQVLINVPVHSKPAFDTMPEVAEQVRRVEEQLGDRGRVVLRYSGTESLARVMIEGPEEEMIERMACAVADAIRRVLG